MSNPHAEAARQRKAMAIATVLAEHGITSADARTMDSSEWDMAAAAASVKRPSEETQRLIVEMLSKEQLAHV